MLRNGEFGEAQSIFYQMMLVGDFTNFAFADLVLANGAKVHYTRTSPGTDEASAVMGHTGTAQNPASPTAFFGSVLRYNSTRVGWDLTFKDGTVYQFAPFGHIGNHLTGVVDRVGNQLTIDRTGTHAEFITRITSPNGRWVDFTNDMTNGMVLQIRDNLGRTVSYAYDASRRLQTVTDAAGGLTTYTYDPNGVQYGLIKTITDARGITYLTNTWDITNRRVTQQTLADSGTYQFAYTVDGSGNITQTDVTDPRGYVRRVTFNASGYPLTDTRAVGTAQAQALTFERNVANLPYSNMVSRATDALGRSTDLTYDSLANVLTVTRYLNAAPITTAYTYEPTFNRVATITDPLSHTTTFTYDASAARNLQSITDALGHQTSFTYDGQGQRLQSLTQGSATVGFGYDDANRRTSVTFPNGIQAAYGYNARDLTGITFTLGGNTLGTLTYTTDADGRRTLMGGTWARTTLPAAITSATYNANNQQTAVGATTLSYDLNGNLTADGATTYTWDARDRLIATSAGTSTFQYDPLGRRTQKVVSGATTRFLYDGDNPVQELDAAGNILANFLTGLGIDEFFTRTDSAGTRTLLGDALNSTLALADDAGTLQTTYTYEAFGAATATGQTSTNSYQYTGRENDGTGLDYYRARYYSPLRQRFLSEDPIGFLAGDTNLYAYVGNEPISSIDPLGLYVASPQAAPLLSATVALSGRKMLVGQGTVVQGFVAAPAGVLIAGAAVVLSAAAFKLYQDWYFERGIFAKKAKRSGKESASDKPSWVDELPLPGEKGKDFADRMMNKKYGQGNWQDTGPASEHSQIKKWADRRMRN